MVQSYAEIGGSRSGSLGVGTASLQVLGPSILRKEAVFVNDSANTIYLSKGATPAVVGSGIRLNANGGVAIIEPDAYGRIWKGPVQAIAVLAGSNLSWSEDW